MCCKPLWWRSILKPARSARWSVVVTSPRVPTIARRRRADNRGQALRVSSNRAAVRLLDEVGLQRTLTTARAFGFAKLPNVPSVALGSGEVTLDEMTAGFAAFANGGLVSRPFLIRRVVDHNGAVLYDHDEPARRAMAPDNAYRLADMLADVIDFGTGSAARRLGFDLPAAGKTGTTNEYRDAWFIGFTPTIVARVWV